MPRVTCFVGNWRPLFISTMSIFPFLVQPVLFFVKSELLHLIFSWCSSPYTFTMNNNQSPIRASLGKRIKISKLKWLSARGLLEIHWNLRNTSGGGGGRKWRWISISSGKKIQFMERKGGKKKKTPHVFMSTNHDGFQISKRWDGCW